MTYGGACVRHNSPVPPPAPKSSCESAEQLFSFFKQQQQPLSPSNSFTAFLPPSVLPSHTPSLSFFPPSSSDTHQSLPEAVIGQLSFSIRQSPEIPSWAQWVPTPKMRKKKSTPVVYIYCATDSTNSLRAV